MRPNFEQLHQDFRPMVLQMCLGFVKGDRDQAEDLAQEVFIKIWKNLSGFRGDSSPKTWIYRITVNVCLQHVRQASKNQMISAEKLPDLQEDSTEETNPAIPELYRAIGKLKETDRLIIMMVLEGQDYEDIAQIMGLNPTTLRVKIHRIKKRLENLLS